MPRPEDDRQQPLDEDERAYLAAFLAVHTPSDAQTQASLGRVEERIAAGEYPAGIDEDEPAPAGRSRWRPVVVLGGVALAVAAAVTLVMRLDATTMLASETAGPTPDAAAYAGQDSGDVEEAVSRRPGHAARPGPVEAAPEESAPEESTEPEPEPTPPEVEPVQDVETESRPRPRRSPRPAPTPDPVPAESEPTPATADATLHAELALLRPAQKALRSGNHARALRLLDDHAKSFPKSVLAPERSLGRIQALCGLGRTQEARRMIAAFGKQHPGSPLTGRVNDACPVEESP